MKRIVLLAKEKEAKRSPKDIVIWRYGTTALYIPSEFTRLLRKRNKKCGAKQAIDDLILLNTTS